MPRLKSVLSSFLHSSSRRGAAAFALHVALLCSSGCILPPPRVESRVLPAEELKAVSMVKRGKDFAMAGRYDLAEQRFRQVLKLEPELTSIYNDLGFVLRGQERLREARQWLEKAVAVEPDGFTPRDNLARVLYDGGDYEEAARQYLLLLEALYRTGEVNTGQGRSREAAIYRSLSAIYYTLGYIDDALCYSALALERAPDVYETGRHVRLLLSLNKVADALDFLRSSFTRLESAHAKLFLDYGVALYASGNFNLSEEAFSQVLGRPEADYTDRRRSRVLRALARKQQGAGEERLAEDLAEIKDADEKLCQSRKTIEESYWPQELANEVETFLEGVCANENRSILWR